MASSKANLRALMAQERARKSRLRPESSEEEPKAKQARFEPSKSLYPENDSASGAESTSDPLPPVERKGILRRAEHRTTVRKTVRFADNQPTVHLIEKSPPINTPLSPFQELIRASGVPYVMRTVNEARELCISAQLNPTEIMESIRMELKDTLEGPRPLAVDERNRKFYDMYWCLSEFLEAQMALAELDSPESQVETVNEETTDVPPVCNTEEAVTVVTNEEDDECSLAAALPPQTQQNQSPSQSDSELPAERAVSNENDPLGTTGNMKNVDSATDKAPVQDDLESFIADINKTTREAVMADQDDIPTEQSVLNADRKRQTDLQEVTVSIDQEIRDLESRAFRGTQPKEFLSRLEARTQSAVANSKIAPVNSKAAATLEESRDLSSGAETVDDLEFLVDDESWRMWNEKYIP